MPRFRLESPRPCTIFCFELIHYAWTKTYNKESFRVSQPFPSINYGWIPHALGRAYSSVSRGVGAPLLSTGFQCDVFTKELHCSQPIRIE